jgi:hypothetical protein
MKLQTIYILCLVATLPSCAFSSEKKDLAKSYRGRFVVVQRDGLSVGFCQSNSALLLGLTVTISGENAKVGVPHPQGFREGVASTMVENQDCEMRDLVRKNTVLYVENAYFRFGRYLTLRVRDLSPRQVEVGSGAFAHQVLMKEEAELLFDTRDVQEAQVSAEKWLKFFDSEDAARASLGSNTASGATVNEIKLGMSFAEVEASLGLPVTKVDLGEKVLYKYKDMTVEFQDGKVSDVR